MTPKNVISDVTWELRTAHGPLGCRGKSLTRATRKRLDQSLTSDPRRKHPHTGHLSKIGT